MKTDLNHDVNHTVWAWTELETPPSPYPRSRFKHAACLCGSYVYVFGGKDGTTPLRDLWRYHLGFLCWEKLKSRGEQLPHLEGQTLLAYKRLVLIFGGELSDGLNGPPLWILNTDLLHIRKISSDNDVADGPTGRRDHTAVIYNNNMYVYGGFIDLKGSTAEFWKFSINEEQWVEVTSRSRATPGGRHGHGAVVVKNTMWLFGGMNGLNVKSDVWRFSFTMRTWHRVKCLGSCPPVTGHSTHIIDNIMYIVGGEVQGELKNDVWCLPLDTLTWRKLSTVNSSSVMPAVTLHASLWIDHRALSQDTDSSRCLSEPYLQSVTHDDSVVIRPVTSPPAAALTSSLSVQFNQISPITLETPDTCSSKRIKPRGHFNKSFDENYYPILARTDIEDEKKNDQKALVRPLSIELDRGVDNIVVCLKDEEQLNDVTRDPVKFWNENSEVKTETNGIHKCVEMKTNSDPANSQTSANEGKDKSVKRDGHTSNKSCHGRNQFVHNSVIKKLRRSERTCNRQLSEENPSRTIRSYLCNDLYVEDLEMVDVSDYIGFVQEVDSNNHKQDRCSESIELCEMSSDQITNIPKIREEKYISDVNPHVPYIWEDKVTSNTAAIPHMPCTFETKLTSDINPHIQQICSDKCTSDVIPRLPISLEDKYTSDINPQTQQTIRSKCTRDAIPQMPQSFNVEFSHCNNTNLDSKQASDVCSSHWMTSSQGDLVASKENVCMSNDDLHGQSFRENGHLVNPVSIGQPDFGNGHLENHDHHDQRVIFHSRGQTEVTSAKCHPETCSIHQGCSDTNDTLFETSFSNQPKDIDFNTQAMDCDSNCHPLNLDFNHQLTYHDSNCQKKSTDSNCQLKYHDSNCQLKHHDPNCQLKHHDSNYQTKHHDSNCQLKHLDSNYQTKHHDSYCQIKHHESNYQLNHQDSDYQTNRHSSNCQPTSQDLKSQPDVGNKLVTTGTQTDISDYCVINTPKSQYTEQAKPQKYQLASSIFTDPHSRKSQLLVIGGKMSKSHIQSKPISLWVTEIFWTLFPKIKNKSV